MIWKWYEKLILGMFGIFAVATLAWAASTKISDWATVTTTPATTSLVPIAEGTTGKTTTVANLVKAVMPAPGAIGGTTPAAGACTTRTYAGAVVPRADDTYALGSTSAKWSDLWLGTGAVINWNAGDVLLTHSANTLAFTGGTSYTFDSALSAASIGVTAAAATGGILDLLEGSDNGSSYLRIQAQASMATTSGFTLSSAASPTNDPIR